MPLSAAERCRRYREKLKETNPAKFEEIKKKNAERTKNKKRKIADLDEEEKKALRKQWRDAKRNKKEKSKVLPEAATNDKQRRKYRSKVLRENTILKEKIQRLQVRHATLRKTLLRYKRKIDALINKLNAITNPIYEEKTPVTPITKFIQEETPNIPEESKQKVRKKLLETRVLEESLKETYKTSKLSVKNTLKKLIVSDSVRKYKMQNIIKKCLGLKTGIRFYHSVKQRKLRTAKEIAKFFERDDISRMTAGKKECITRNKNKKQKRILINTLSNLYKIYRNEGGSLSFSTFKRYRPFHVVFPRVSNRNTCACIKHSNLKFKSQALKKLGLISSSDPQHLLSEIVCDIKSNRCMYSECTICADKKLTFAMTDAILYIKVTWSEWTTQRYEYEKAGICKTTKRTILEKKTDTLNVLTIKFQEELAKFKIHFYNIYHQLRQYKEAIENIQDNEVIIHCDFSENYGCKMAEEIQSMHFAGSRQQITLHTGVLYIKRQKPISFCSISPSLKHDPQAIWGHLKPVIGFVKEHFTDSITCVHFFSDGPTTQYRQKKNFLLFAEKIKEAGFIQGTWSFFEASHGKGAADGVGGTIKRTLDRKVAYGENIVDAISAYQALSETETTIKLFYVSENCIQNIQVPENLQPVPKTMQIHQIIATEDQNTIKYRPLSCFCARGNCNCYSPKKHDIILRDKRITKTEIENKTKNKKKRQNDKKKVDNNMKKAKKIKKGSASTSEDTGSSDIQYDDDSANDCLDTSNDEAALETSIEMDNTRKKVIVLSDIRNSEENQAYFDLTKYGPITFKSINLDLDLFSPNNKENIDIEAKHIAYSSKDEHETAKDEKSKVEQISETYYTLNDSILVRYYQRKNWKYYIGFIDKMERKNDDTFYTVRFLKTIHIKNEIKFIIPKKKDIDIITGISIVKNIKIYLKQAGEYCLIDDADKTYFL